MITNNIIQWNGRYGIVNYNASATIDYNDVWGNAWLNYANCSPGPNDISQNPMLVNPGAGDYHLQATSPCIDRGTNGAPALPGTDLDGNLRVLDGDGDGTMTVDMPGVPEMSLSMSGRHRTALEGN